MPTSVLNSVAALPVDDRDVEDGGRVTDHGVEQRRQSLVLTQRGGHGLAQRGWILRIYRMDSDPGVQRIAGREKNLMGEGVVGFVRLFDLLPEQLAQIERRQDGHQKEDQSSNGQYEFGLQTHM